MKTKITLGLFLALLLGFSALKAQTVTPLYNFETGTTQAGTYALYWAGAPYIKAFDVIANPVSTGINTSAKVLRIQEEGVQQWWNNTVVFNLTTPVTVNSTNRYLHIKHLRPRITGGGFVVNLNAAGSSDGFATVPNRFGDNLTATNTWQDIVIDLNTLITNNSQLSNVNICIDVNDWGGASTPLGDYLFDDIILSSSPLPRGTTFLTGNNLYDFEPGTAANITGINTSADANNPVTYPVVNPYQTGMNLTANVGKRTAAATTNYWTGFGFTFANPIQVDVNHKYLHIMMIVPANGQQVLFDVIQGATKVIADGIKVITTANTWQDVVIDVSGMNYISGMYIKCGSWNGTAVGDYYFDEIRIDGNSAPRVNTVTALNSAVNNSKIYSSNGNIVIESNTIGANVTIFNSCGQKVATKEIGTNASISVKNKGIYFVNIGNKTTKVIVQ